MIFARRGDCLLAVRDARGGANFKSVFSADARSIGPVRYLYKGRAYDEPPSVAFRLGRLQNEVLNRIGFARSVSVPLAMASNAACEGSNFGLESTRIPS